MRYWQGSQELRTKPDDAPIVFFPTGGSKTAQEYLHLILLSRKIFITFVNVRAIVDVVLEAKGSESSISSQTITQMLSGVLGQEHVNSALH